MGEHVRQIRVKAEIDTNKMTYSMSERVRTMANGEEAIKEFFDGFREEFLEDASETDVLRGMVGYFLELYMGETGGFMGSPKDLLDSARHEYKNGLETLKKLEEND